MRCIGGLGRLPRHGWPWARPGGQTRQRDRITRHRHWALIYVYHASRHVKIGGFKNQLATNIDNHHPIDQKTTTPPPPTTSPLQTGHVKSDTTATMPSADWEQHFLDKFLASSSRSSSPSPTASTPRNSSPARWNSTPRQSLDVQVPRNVGSPSPATNITSAAAPAIAR
jgi:hypothetical protein